MTLKERFVNWLDEDDGRRAKAITLVCIGTALTTAIVTGKLNKNKRIKADAAKLQTVFTPKNLPKPNISKGILTEFLQNEDGLSFAYIASGEFEFLDDRTLCVKDLGKIGEAFVNTPGTFIGPDTAVDLMIQFQDRA